MASSLWCPRLSERNISIVLKTRTRMQNNVQLGLSYRLKNNEKKRTMWMMHENKHYFYYYHLLSRQRFSLFILLFSHPVVFILELLHTWVNQLELSCIFTLCLLFSWIDNDLSDVLHSHFHQFPSDRGGIIHSWTRIYLDQPRV